MSEVTIQKYRNTANPPQKPLQKVEAIMDSIRQRAFNLFEKRSGGNGSEAGDWLQAERDLVWMPESELVDAGKEFKANIAVPGFDAKEIEVSATPNELIVQADAVHSHDKRNGDVCFCEFSEKTLFRRLPLPESIDVDKVTASLDKGILQLIAPKAESKQMAAAGA